MDLGKAVEVIQPTCTTGYYTEVIPSQIDKQMNFLSSREQVLQKNLFPPTPITIDESSILRDTVAVSEIFSHLVADNAVSKP